MNDEMIGAIVLGLLTVGFVWLAVKAIKRSAERKKELFAEDDGPQIPDAVAEEAAELEPVAEVVPERARASCRARAGPRANC